MEKGHVWSSLVVTILASFSASLVTVAAAVWFLRGARQAPISPESFLSWGNVTQHGPPGHVPYLAYFPPISSRSLSSQKLSRALVGKSWKREMFGVRWFLTILS